MVGVGKQGWQLRKTPRLGVLGGGGSLFIGVKVKALAWDEGMKINWGGVFEWDLI